MENDKKSIECYGKGVYYVDSKKPLLSFAYKACMVGTVFLIVLATILSALN